LPTLYAYVSRGLIRSEAVDGEKRLRRYRLEDVQALKARKELRHNPVKAAESALHFGAPVLQSAITLIADGRFYYRGYDALLLAQESTIEEVAALIWTGNFTTVGLFPRSAEPTSPTLYELIASQLAGLAPIEAFQVVLPLVAAGDLAAYDLAPAAVAQTGARILQWLTLVATGNRPAGSMAQALQLGWAPAQAEAIHLLNTALILCADHELNISSFTARCVASAGATPYGVVMAGLAALQGARHGGHTERVAALFREVASPAGGRIAKQVQAAIAGRLKRGEGIPGFGHRLYPEGDPRARLLLDRVSAACPNTLAVELAREIMAEVGSTVDFQPTIDFGLVTLAEALQMPPGAALALFALGRAVGWIGHAIEQYQVEWMIRPRARYVGEQPEPPRSAI
jgi:citrate synthase